MELCVTLSANAGVAIHIGGRRIWVDALHDKKQRGFSTVDGQLQQRMLSCEAFFRPEYICYTHCHGDHYSEKLTDAAIQLWPNAKVMAPEGKYYAVEGRGSTLEDDGLSLRFVRLPHEGAQYRDVRHYGLIIGYQGCNVLIAGDCALESRELEQVASDNRIDLVLLTFPWIARKQGREWVLRHLAGSKLLIYHIPFAGDDINGYRQAANKAASMMPETMDVRLLMQPLQTENYMI